MKTLKKVPYQLMEVEYIEPPLKPNIFYFSRLYKSSNHLCPCGCGTEVPVPIKPGEWLITINKDGTFSLNHSFQQRMGCKSHWVIKDGMAILLDG